MAPDPDLDLLRRALEGDDGAFTELVKRHEDRIFALALRMMGSRSDAFDATQETFLTAYRKGKGFKGDSAFSTWLYRVGINTCKDLLRKRARTPIPTDDEVQISRSAYDPAVAERVATRLDVRNALARLPDDYREAVAMHDLGGIPYEEIAQITGAAIGTVKSRISRGRRKLAELMEHRADLSTSKEQT